MSLPIRLLPEARDEFDAAVDWYEQQRPGLGTAFLDRVRDVLARIAANPQLHAILYQDVRKAVVQKFPYVVLYKEESGEVVVIAVSAHIPGQEFLQHRIATCFRRQGIEPGTHRHPPRVLKRSLRCFRMKLVLKQLNALFE